MKSFRQKLIEDDLKQGKSVGSKGSIDSYVEAIFMIDKKGSFDKEGTTSQEEELKKEYRFKIKKSELSSVIDVIRSLPGVTIQTKTDMAKMKGAMEKDVKGKDLLEI